MDKKKVLLAKVKEYEIRCDGICHYFTGKKLKDVKVGKCWCRKGGK